MGRTNQDESPAELPKSVMKNLPTGWADDAEGMSAAQLRGAVIDAETAIREAETEMKADDKLAAAKEVVKDLSSGYREVVKAQRAKIAYALHLLDGRGEL